jgi:plastocyanin
VTIPVAQDIFEPFILEVKPGTTVTWQNKDTVTHGILTTSEQNNFLNPTAFSLKVQAGQSMQFTFKQPGLYHYYDNTKATWNTADARVQANKGVPRYPLAMDAVIWVQGPISGLPSAETNRLPNGRDDFLTEFIGINPGSVSWHNFDTDTHFLSLVPGWSAPATSSQADINPTEIGTNRIAGTNDVPGGDTITLLFNKPGLYYYYCATHATIDAATHRASAIKDASEYPIPMEGFVLVVGS